MPKISESEIQIKPLWKHPKSRDYSGEKFNSLTVIGFAGNASWYCRCECGTFTINTLHSIKSGNTKSCGCGLVKATIKRSTKHGHARRGKIQPEYNSWYAMKERCLNPSHKNYHQYGGRGITIDPRWLGDDGASNFLADMGPKPSKKHSLDRIDVNAGYGPTNCRWVTQTDQTRNTRRNIMLTYNGETKSLPEWCEILGLSYGAIKQRLSKLKWSVEKAFSVPVLAVNRTKGSDR